MRAIEELRLQGIRASGALSRALVAAHGAARRAGLLEDPLSRSLFVRTYFLYKRWLEDPFAWLVREHADLFQGGHILDVGANVGYTAVTFARAVEAPYRVYAFEPESTNYAMLREAVDRYGAAGRVETVRAAVGAEAGQVALWRNLGHSGDHRVVTDELRRARPGLSTELVPLVSIDDFVRHLDAGASVAFVKIDVQGYELAVCEGMSQTLARNPRAAVALEYCPEASRELGFDARRVVEFLRDHGLRVELLGRGRLEPAPNLESIERAAAARGYVDLLGSRRP